MKKFEFNASIIGTIIDAGVVLFNAQHISAVLGYTSLSGVKYHVPYMKEVNNVPYVTTRDLMNLANKAKMRKVSAKALVKLAIAYTNAELEALKQDNAKLINVSSVTLFTVAEVAKYVGMSTSELSDWLVAKGHCGRYSNGNLSLNSGFKLSGYAKKPTASSGKESNVIRLTVAGKEFIKNRLESERSGSVLTFAKATVNEEAKLEAELDALIERTFAVDVYHAGTKDYIDISKEELNRKIKVILAVVKLKKG